MINLEKCSSKIRELPVGEFRQVLTEKNRVSVVYKFDEPVYTDEFTIKPNKKFSLFELGSLSSLNIMFAYVFTFDFKNYDIKEKYFIIRRPSTQNLANFTNVELVYQSSYINIYNSEDGASLISVNGLSRVIATEIVRKSKKNK